MNAASRAADGPPRLEVRGVSKTFAGRTVLSDVSLAVEPGQLHGIVGQNGSGKSTLAKVITGYHAPDPGASIRVDGRSLRLPIRPRDLREAGVSIVHQDLGLVDTASVVENVRIAVLRASGWSRRVDWRSETEPAQVALDRLGYTGGLDTPVARLSPADRAKVAIGRAIQDHAPGSGLIIFDESTRALPSDALAEFYGTVRQLLDDGTGVLIIGHRLDEILEHCDRVTVLRDGRCAVSDLPTDGVSEGDLARRMLGHSLERLTLAERADRTTAPVVSVRGLAGPGLARPMDLELRRGEIVGFTGLPGSGFEALPYLLSGARPAHGRLVVSGEELDLEATSLTRLVRAGVVLVPENRPRDGVGLGHTVEQNVALPWLGVQGKSWWLGSAWQRREAEQVVRSLGVQPPDPSTQVGRLSGGNQQKVLLGKWLVGAPKLLLLHEPTQAVDVKARQDLLRAIHDVAQRGTAVLIASTEPEDLVTVCDRVVLFEHGAPAVELPTPFEAAQVIDGIYSTSAQPPSAPTSAQRAAEGGTP